MVGCFTESTVGISAVAQLLPLVDHADVDGAALLAEDVKFRELGLLIIDEEQVDTAARIFDLDADGFAERRYVVRTHRRNALLLTVEKKEHTNTVAVAREVRGVLERFRSRLDAGLDVRERIVVVHGGAPSSSWSCGRSLRGPW